MGLCKCRVVTNLFCFDHNTNVCENCLEPDHERCIVRTYVQWLEDSEYESVCKLCAGSLQEGEVLRLICYDVFHWSCLDKHCQALPKNTTMAGYQCPVCDTCIIPAPELESPLAHSVLKRLNTANWAKTAIAHAQTYAPKTHTHQTLPTAARGQTLNETDQAVHGAVQAGLMRTYPEVQNSWDNVSAVQMSQAVEQSPRKKSVSVSSSWTRLRRRLGLRPIAFMGRDISRLAVLLLLVALLLLVFR